MASIFTNTVAHRRSVLKAFRATAVLQARNYEAFSPYVLKKQFGLAQFRQNTEPQLDSQKTQIFLSVKVSLRLHGAVVTKEIQKQKFEKYLSLEMQ